MERWYKGGFNTLPPLFLQTINAKFGLKGRGPLDVRSLSFACHLKNSPKGPFYPYGLSLCISIEDPDPPRPPPSRNPGPAPVSIWSNVSHQELGTDNIYRKQVSRTPCVSVHVHVWPVASRGGGGRGASAPGPGPVGARAKLDFFFFFDRKSVGDPGFW